MEKLHTDLGRLAVEKGYLTEQKLTECIKILDEEGSDKKIEEILTQKGYLNNEKLDYLHQKRKLNIKKIETQALIEYLIKMKIVPKDRLDLCIETQKKAQEQKSYIPLSKLIVSHGLLSQEKMDETLLSKEIQRIIRQAMCEDDPRHSGMLTRVLGGYEIVSEIASGGMGTVFRAVQLELDRTVALKILFNQFASQKKHLAQFYREAKLSASLNHPNLVHIFEVGNDQGFYYYSMELVEGVNLGDFLKENEGLEPFVQTLTKNTGKSYLRVPGKFDQEGALDIIIQAAEGLEHLHSFGVVHQDIKPSNFIIRPDGIVKIMDLGLARHVGQVQKKSSAMGTPYYMAPELINNPQAANHRADIYALGVSFYKMLTGEYPITGTDAKEILKNILEQVPKPVGSLYSEVNPDITKIIDKMIAKDVSKRYQNMKDVLNDLDRVLIVE